MPIKIPVLLALVAWFDFSVAQLLTVTHAVVNSTGTPTMVGGSLPLCVDIGFQNTVGQPVSSGCAADALKVRLRIMDHRLTEGKERHMYPFSARILSNSTLASPPGTMVCSATVECSFRVNRGFCLHLMPLQSGYNLASKVNVVQAEDCSEFAVQNSVPVTSAPIHQHEAPSFRTTCSSNAFNDTICEPTSVVSWENSMGGSASNCVSKSLFSSSSVWHSFDTSGYTGNSTGVRVSVPAVNRRKHTLLLAVQSRVQATNANFGIMMSIQTNLSSDVLSLNSWLSLPSSGLYFQQMWLFNIFETQPNTPFEAEIKLGSPVADDDKPCLFPSDSISKSRNLIAVSLPSEVGVFHSKVTGSSFSHTVSPGSWYDMATVSFEVPAVGNWSVLLFGLTSRFQTTPALNPVYTAFFVDSTALPFRSSRAKWSSYDAKWNGGMTAAQVGPGSHVAKLSITPYAQLEFHFPHDNNGFQQRDLTALVVASSSVAAKRWDIPCSTAENLALCEQPAATSMRVLTINNEAVRSNFTLAAASDIVVFFTIGRVQSSAASTTVDFSLYLDGQPMQDFVLTAGHSLDYDMRPVIIQLHASAVSPGSHVVEVMQRSSAIWRTFSNADGMANIELTLFVPAAADNHQTQNAVQLI